MNDNQEPVRPLRSIVLEQLQHETVIRELKTHGKFVDMPFPLFENLLQMALSNPIYMVEEFHRVYGLHVKDEPCITDRRVNDRRFALLEEEWMEYQEAYESRDIQGLLDALCDIIYVAVGAALELGLPIRHGLVEVHRSNMSKLDLDGKPIYREDGKILKGPNYSPPNWVEVFQEWEEEKGKV